MEEKERKELSVKYEQLNKELERLRLHRIEETFEEPSTNSINNLSQINNETQDNRRDENNQDKEEDKQ